MKYAVAVQNTDTHELSLMGPYTKEVAEHVRDTFVADMDERYGLLDVYSVWVVPLRTMATETNALSSLFDLYNRVDPYNRTLDNLAQLDI